MFNCSQFKKLIIQPVLHVLDVYSQEAEELLIGTCAQESQGGTYLFQNIVSKNMLETFSKGLFAVGIYQMEPKTHDDIWKNFLTPHVLQKPNKIATIVEKLKSFCNVADKPSAELMLYNLYYATAMARMHYYRVQEPIPKTLNEQAAYYKKYYNTPDGAASIEEYILNYNKFTGGKA